ncbi:MAG: HNH endonuclease [Leptolyngbyaceae cyanobacterium RU_5_1]|nr:HNH endonuclease [Leptolyngbyaceae cyanobacterium RU_5_1]
MTMSSREKRSKKKRIVKRDGNRCCWCKKQLKDDQMTIEHLTPQSLGGSDSIENLRIACFKCNNSRGNRPYPPGYVSLR